MSGRLLTVLFVMSFPLLLASCDSEDVGDEGRVDARFVIDSTQTAEATPRVLASDVPVNLDGITPAGGDLLELLEKGLLAPYAAHYVTTLSDGSEGDTYDMYNLPPLVRIDTTPPGEQTPSNRLISKEGGGNVTCDRVTESWECLPLEGQSTDVLTGSGPIVYPGQPELKSTVSEVQGRSIAGQQTRCFEIASQQSGTASTYCVTPAGVVLFASTEFGTTEAVLYDPVVSEDKFVVP